MSTKAGGTAADSATLPPMDVDVLPWVRLPCGREHHLTEADAAGELIRCWCLGGHKVKELTLEAVAWLH